MTYCEECDRYFVNDAAMWDHMKHSSLSHPKCQRCNLFFRTMGYLEEHIDDDANHHPCQCCNPRIDFFDQAALDRHIEDKICRACDRQFGSVGALDAHLKATTRQHPHCPRCALFFASDDRRIEHLYNSPRHFICNCCTPRLDHTTQDSLNKHVAAKPTCNICNRYFVSDSALQAHLQNSTVEHPKCFRCPIFFASDAKLEYHRRNSPVHNRCECCTPNLDFEKHEQLLEHLLQKQAEQVHKNEIADRERKVKNMDFQYTNYKGIQSNLIKPVFDMAQKLKWRNPTVAQICDAVDTDLDTKIIASLIEAAMRVVPANSSPESLVRRQQDEAAKAALAKVAENSFFNVWKVLGFDCLSESQQRKLFKGTDSTPDIYFKNPVDLFGVSCNWIEYKNFFGFKANPFIHAKNKQQFQRYAKKFGPGVVVYSLGYETGCIDLPGVSVYHEGQVREALKRYAVLEGRAVVEPKPVARIGTVTATPYMPPCFQVPNDYARYYPFYEWDSD